MFSLFSKNKDSKEEVTTSAENSDSQDGEWGKNLSWSDEITPEKIYIKGYKELDHDQISAASNMAMTSNRIYTTLPKDDTSLVILVKKLENFPKLEDILRKREYYRINVSKLEQARKALIELMQDLHDTNASLTLAYTTIDSDLRHAVVEERSFEAKLKMEAQSIEDLVELFAATDDYQKVLLLAEMYGFEKALNDELVHVSAIVDELETSEPLITLANEISDEKEEKDILIQLNKQAVTA
jgi:hypothetical protein